MAGIEIKDAVRLHSVDATAIELDEPENYAQKFALITLMQNLGAKVPPWL